LPAVCTRLANADGRRGGGGDGVADGNRDLRAFAVPLLRTWGSLLAGRITGCTRQTCLGLLCLPYLPVDTLRMAATGIPCLGFRFMASSKLASL